MTAERFKLKIDRSIWLRGKGVSRLLDDNGKRCCVGIYLGALGVEDEELMHTGAADDLACPIPRWLGESKRQNCRTESAQDLYWINDAPLGTTINPWSGNESIMLHASDRERRIAEIFGRNGVDVEFIGPEEEV